MHFCEREKKLLNEVQNRERNFQTKSAWTPRGLAMAGTFRKGHLYSYVLSLFLSLLSTETICWKSSNLRGIPTYFLCLIYFYFRHLNLCQSPISPRLIEHASHDPDDKRKGKCRFETSCTSFAVSWCTPRQKLHVLLR